MPIDEEKIQEYEVKLSKQRSIFEKEIAEIDRIIKNFRTIRLVVKINPNAKSEKDARSMVIPIDERTGKPFTSQRRQQIFDDNIIDVKKLIG